MRHAPRLAFIIFVIFLVTTWLEVHSWESYMYAAASEGFFSLSDWFSSAQDGAPLPDVSRFHPYHPLFHFLVGWLRPLLALTGLDSALVSAVVLNKTGGIGVAFFTYKILRHQRLDPQPAMVLTACLCCSKAILFGSFSGDAHMVSLAFFLASLHGVLCLPSHEGPATIRALIYVVLFALGAAMNLAVVYYGLLPLGLLIKQGRKREACFAISFGALLLSVAYLLCPVVLLNLSSPQEYLQLFSLYANMPRDPVPWLLRPVEFGSALGQAIVGGNSLFSNLLRTSVALLFTLGVWQLWRKRNTGHDAWWLLIWVIGFALGEFIPHTERSINGVVYVAPSLVAVCGFGFQKLGWTQWSRPIWFALAVTFCVHNLLSVILPKVTPPESSLPQLARLKETLPTDIPVAALVDHMSLFPEIYYLGHSIGVKNITPFTPLTSSSRRKMTVWLQENPKGCFLSSNPIMLPGYGVQVRTVTPLDPDVYHYSVNHDVSHRVSEKSVFFACRFR